MGAEDSAPVDTQYYLLYNDEAVVLVFRGSEGELLSPKGSKQNVKFVRDWINTDANVKFMRRWGRKMGKVHSGFYWAYAAVKRAHSLIPRIKKCMRHKDPHNPGKGNRGRKRALFLAGHSLGGAVAQVAAFDISRYEKYLSLASTPMGVRGLSALS
ncbi:MAG: lipase family protein [Bradymonadia bacterium]